MTTPYKCIILSVSLSTFNIIICSLSYHQEHIRLHDIEDTRKNVRSHDLDYTISAIVRYNLMIRYVKFKNVTNEKRKLVWKDLYTMYHTVTPQLFPKPFKFKTSHNHQSYIIFLSVTYPYNLILINVYNI